MSRINPLHIIFGLLALVFVVNAAFLWVAIEHAEPVAPSYLTEER